MTMKTRTPKTWHAVRAVLRGKFIAMQTYLKEREKHQINNLNLHLKQLRGKKKKKKKKNKIPKGSRSKEIIKIRA